MKILDSRIAASDELLNLGSMFPEVEGSRIALEVATRGGGKRDLLRRIADRMRDQPLADLADRMLGISTSDDDFRGYSITKAIMASCNRSWERARFEESISDLVTTKSGQAPNGFFVPIGQFARDFNMGTASEAGNLSGKDRDDDGQYTRDPLRRLSALGRLGASIITGRRETLSLPFFSSATTAAFLSEVGSATAIAESTTDVTMMPKRCAATLVMSRQALLQATPQLDTAITRQLIAACMEQVEWGALNGAGAGDDPVGLRSTSGVGAVAGGTNGAQIAYSHLADLEALPAAANVAELNPGFLVNSKSRRWLRTQPKAAGLPYCWDNQDLPLLGRRAEVSNLLPSNLTKGASGAVCSTLIYGANWQEVVLCFYGPASVDITVDRITFADVGKLRITAAMYVGVGVLCPSAFAKMDDGLTV